MEIAGAGPESIIAFNDSAQPAGRGWMETNRHRISGGRGPRVHLNSSAGARCRWPPRGSRA